MDKLELVGAILKELNAHQSAPGSVPGAVDVLELVAWILMREKPDTKEKTHIVRSAINGKDYYLAPPPRSKTTDIRAAKRLTKEEAERYVKDANAKTNANIKFEAIYLAPPSMPSSMFPMPGDYFDAT